jgi:hypothetical protein
MLKMNAPAHRWKRIKCGVLPVASSRATASRAVTMAKRRLTPGLDFILGDVW